VISPVALYEHEIPPWNTRNYEGGIKGGWRKLLDEELCSLHSSPNVIRVSKSTMRWSEHVAHMGETRNTYEILVGKPEGC